MLLLACSFSIEKEGVHEIGTANFVLGGGPAQGTEGRTRNSHSEFRASVGMLLGGGRRARNWHSEFCGAPGLKKGVRGGAPSMWPQRREELRGASI